MRNVRAKKHLGQHFLKDPEIAKRIVASLVRLNDYRTILEVGPGMGVLSDYLFEIKDHNIFLIEIDKESISYLKDRFQDRTSSIIEADFLRLEMRERFRDNFAIIGNFPYNISSQILFRILDHRDLIPEAVGMFQKEVAERIVSGPGGREYGILSVLMQAFYNVELLFSLDEKDFSPPPAVKSAVLRFSRKENFDLGCDEALFRRIVKAAFNQRRKTLRNALSVLEGRDAVKNLPYMDLRAEKLGWQQFAELCRIFADISAKDQKDHKGF
jgi:16S rRNA (adenine1518-N6/adenine1519-N6)-dimethyltransferase